MSNLGWKVVLKINGKKVDEALCLNKKAAHHIITLVVNHGLEVYSVKNIKTVQFSILKNRSAK